MLFTRKIKGENNIDFPRYKKTLFVLSKLYSEYLEFWQVNQIIHKMTCSVNLSILNMTKVVQTICDTVRA